MTAPTDTVTPLAGHARSRGGGLRGLLFAFLVTLLAGLAFSAAFVLGYARLHDGKAMPGVSVGGVSIGGLDRAEAEARLREKLPKLDAGTLTITIGSATKKISYAELGRDYDLAPVLDEAFTVGRNGVFLDQVTDQFISLTHGVTFAPGMHYDQAALQRVVQAAAHSVVKAPVDATVSATTGAFATTPSSTGLAVDEQAVVDAATTAIAGTATATSDVAISVDPTVVQPVVTMETVTAAVAQAVAFTRNDVHLTAGDQTFTIPAATLRGWVTFTMAAAGTVDVKFDTSGLAGLIGPFAKNLTKPAENASFKFEGSKIVPVPGSDGETLDVDASAALVDAAIRNQQPSASAPTIKLAVAPLVPDYTTEEAKADASKMRRVSQWTTHFPVSDHNFFGKNISLPTTAINGTVIAPGKIFDFWKVVGEVSRRTGYGPGGAIVNGHTQPTGALAGGICSCSTTIFNAALRLGLDMGTRRNHYYYITRYPLGLDATVFKSNGGAVQTMTWKNDTPYPILIRGINSYGVVRFELWSQPIGRKVTFTRPIVRSVKVATDDTACTTQLPAGVSRRVEFPTNGMQVWVTRTVTDASGALVHRETYHSNYSRVNGLVLFGKPAGFSGVCNARLPQ